MPPKKTTNREKTRVLSVSFKKKKSPNIPTGEYAYVFDRNQTMHLYPLDREKNPNFSFLDESQILAVGTIKIKKGKIRGISNLLGNTLSKTHNFKAALREIPKDLFSEEGHLFFYLKNKEDPKSGNQTQRNFRKIDLSAPQYYEYQNLLDAIKKSVTNLRSNETQTQKPLKILNYNKALARRILLQCIVKEIDVIMSDTTRNNHEKKKLLERLNQGVAAQFAPILTEKIGFWGVTKRKSHTQKMIEMHLTAAFNTLNDAEFSRKGRFISAQNDLVPSKRSDQTINGILSRFSPEFIRKTVLESETNPYREAKTETYMTMSTKEIQALAPPFETAENLSEEELREYAKQALICKSGSSPTGNLTAIKTTHVFMENIVAINGHYNAHAQMSQKEQEHLSTLSEEARLFFETHFPPELSRQLIENNGAIIDNNTGLVANILYEKNSNGKPTIHVVFGGTGTAGLHAQNISTDLSLLANPSSIPPSFTQARDLVGLVKHISGEDAQVEVKGFSLGGAFAAYAGLSHQLKTVCLSPMPLPPIVWRDLANRYGHNLSRLVKNHLLNLTVEGDMATHWKFASLGRAMEGGLFDLPHVLGKTYMIPRQSLLHDEDMIDDFTGYGVHSNAALLWSKLLLKRMLKQAHVTSTQEIERQKADFLRGKTSDIEYPALEHSKQSTATINSSSAALFFQHKLATERMNAFRQALIEFNAHLSVKIGISLFSKGEKLIERIKGNARYLQQHYSTMSANEKVAALEKLLKMVDTERIYNPVSTYAAELAGLHSHLANEYRAIKPELAKNAPVAVTPKATAEETDAVFTSVQDAVEHKSSLKMINHPNSQENYLVNLPLATGDEIWPATYELIMKAKKSIKLTTYLFYEGSESAKWIYKALYDLQQKQQQRLARGEEIEPINIEFVVDDSQGPIRQKNKREVTAANPISNYGIGCPFRLNPQLIHFTVYGMKHYKRGSLHEKVVTVDDEYAIVSTCNIKNVHHAAGSKGTPRFDAAIIMKGGVTHSLNEGIDHQKSHPNTVVLGTNAYQKNAAIKAYPQQFMPLPYDENNKERIKKIQHVLRAEEMDLIGPFDAVAIAKAGDNSIVSPKAKSSPQYEAILAALNQAKKCIKISHTNLNIPEVLDALVAAAERGVRVQIVIPPEVMDAESALDAKSNYQAYQYLTEKVRVLGKESFLDLRFEGRNGHMISKDITLQSHCKYMNVDDVAFFGSMNLDVQSWKYSSEVSVAFKQEEAVKLLDQHYFYFLFDQSVPYKLYEQQEIPAFEEVSPHDKENPYSDFPASYATTPLSSSTQGMDVSNPQELKEHQPCSIKTIQTREKIKELKEPQKTGASKTPKCT